MSRCVPSWNVEDDHSNNGHTGHLKASLPNSMSSNLDVPVVDYEVAELTWKNGQLAMHGLCPPRAVYKTNTTKYSWDKPLAAGTLETIVNQASLQRHGKPHNDLFGSEELVPWLDHHGSALAAGSVSASATMTMDALVPSSGTNVLVSVDNGCSTRVGSCSIDRSGVGDHVVGYGGGSVAVREWSSCRDESGSGSGSGSGSESSRQLTAEIRKRELGVKGFTSTSTGSPDDTTSGKSTMSTSPDERDSVCHSRPQMVPEEKKKGKGKSSIPIKRSRAAAIHNLSERRRRDKINQKMKTLQKLVPNANKTDKASMLDEVIEYLKQLQAQVHMIGRMSMSPMMMPLAMQQQQLQMAMMNHMGMGIGMGIGMSPMGMAPMPGVMDINTIASNRPNIPGMPPVFHPSAFMSPMPVSWDMQAATGDRVPNHNDPMAAFLACQSQPMTMECYSRMAALFQQMQNQSGYSGLKNLNC